MTRSGLVLAGGRSRRFGDEDKAVATLDGEPMVRRVVERLAPVVDEVVVNCRADQVERIEAALDPAAARFAVDPLPDRGPVAGLRTGLRTARGAVAAVAACDMPGVDPSFLESLFADAEGERGAVPVVDGRPQPLCGVYRVDPAVEACDTTLATGSARLQNVLAHLDPVRVAEPTVRARTDAETFRNVNTPADLEAAETGRT